MIKVNRGNIEINGNYATVLSEYTVLTRNLNEALRDKLGAEESRKNLERCFNDAFKTVDELEAEVMKLLKETNKQTTKALIEDFKKILEGFEDE